MTRFEIGKAYAKTSMGRKGTSDADTYRVIRRSDKFVTFITAACEKFGFTEETERVKIRATEIGEMAVVFGGLVSDSVYAKDEV